jgi:hypothetical protein
MVKDVPWGDYDVPMMQPTQSVPLDLVRFSDARMGKKPRQGDVVHFFEHDDRIKMAWDEPRRCLAIIRKFSGAIAPDFSTYRDFPQPLRDFDCTRNFTCGAWWQKEGVDVIANIRLHGHDSLEKALDGAPRGSTVAVSTLGSMARGLDRQLLGEELELMCERLRPTFVVTYGRLGEEHCAILDRFGVAFKTFKSHIDQVHGKE